MREKSALERDVVYTAFEGSVFAFDKMYLPGFTTCLYLSVMSVKRAFNARPLQRVSATNVGGDLSGSFFLQLESQCILDIGFEICSECIDITHLPPCSETDGIRCQRADRPDQYTGLGNLVSREEAREDVDQKIDQGKL